MNVSFFWRRRYSASLDPPRERPRVVFDATLHTNTIHAFMIVFLRVFRVAWCRYHVLGHCIGWYFPLFGSKIWHFHPEIAPKLVINRSKYTTVFSSRNQNVFCDAWCCIVLLQKPVEVQHECAQSRNEVGGKRSTQKRAKTRNCQRESYKERRHTIIALISVLMIILIELLSLTGVGNVA